jgi:hypothetical protein
MVTLRELPAANPVAIAILSCPADRKDSAAQILTQLTHMESAEAKDMVEGLPAMPATIRFPSRNAGNDAVAALRAIGVDCDPDPEKEEREKLMAKLEGQIRDCDTLKDLQDRQSRYASMTDTERVDFDNDIQALFDKVIGPDIADDE